MFVIKLANGNLKVPQTAVGMDGQVLADAYVEIGPQDADYARLAAQALTEEEVARHRERWRAGDEALRREFLEFARHHASAPFGGDEFGGDEFGPGRPRDEPG